MVLLVCFFFFFFFNDTATTEIYTLSLHDALPIAAGLRSSPPDGSIPSEAGGGPVLPVAVLLNTRSLEVLYAGNAPGLVINLLQINLRLPQQGAGGEFQLMIGSFFSDPFSLAVQ